MDDFQLTKETLHVFFDEIQTELDVKPFLLVSTKTANTGKWGMAKLWRAWMDKTGEWMASNGATMPLFINSKGEHIGTRPFDKNDAHEMFTHYWLGVGEDGLRLSWSKKGRDGMRAATKGERYIAMMKHEHWCIEKGLTLFKPRDSEYSILEQEQNK